MKPRGIRDTRASAGRAGKKFEGMLARAMAGDLGDGDGAEQWGMRCLGLICAEFVMGTSPLGESLRTFVSKVMNREDPIRKDIPIEVWSAIWPTLNTITHARGKYAEGLKGSAEQHRIGVLGNANLSSEGIE